MIKKESGQIFILAVITLGLILVNTVLIAGRALTFSQASDYSILLLQAANLAEAGIDKAVSSLNKTGGRFTDDGSTEYVLGGGTYTIKISSKTSSTNLIEVTSFVPNKAKAKAKKTIKIDIAKGFGFAFNYGLQVGNGGLEMGNGSNLNGSVYSNGNITGGNNNRITGDAWVAGGVQPSADQSFDCTPPNCTDFIFGKSVGGESQYDVAQSFKPNISSTLNKVSLKLRKFGNPSSLSVRIVKDDFGHPERDVLATGTLNASLVTNNPSFVDVSFTSPPNLISGTTYWIVADTCGNSTNACNNSQDYWAWDKDTLSGYLSGNGMWSNDWNKPNPIWSNVSGDLAFKTYMGGVATKIEMGNGSVVNGDVHASIINGITVSKDAYFQTLIDSVVQGSSYPNSSDPPPTVFPVSEANIEDWKSQAQLGMSYTGQSGCNLAFESGKLTGDLEIASNCNVAIKSPFWITGNLILGNNSKFVLDSNYGASSGVIIVDGTIVVGNGSDFKGSGQTGSYLMILTTYDSGSSGSNAITVGNSFLSCILYAPLGIVELSNGASFNEISAWKIKLGNESVLNYESGLSGTFFSSGPSGSFSVIKGSYQSN